jgi:hypothetical protein
MIRLFLKRAKSRTVNLPLLLAAACLCASTVGAAQVHDDRPSFPVTSSQIVSAMQGRQLPTQGAQIRIAAPITASLENPQLDIQAIALVSPREIRLRMSCRNRTVCPSFFALASYPQVVNADTLPTIIESSSPNSQTVANSQHLSLATATAVPTQQPKPDKAAPAEPTLRIGSSVMLQIDGDRVHILIEVVCLENGSTGDKIRVTTRDHKQSYVAQIVTPTLLKGSL